MAAWGLVAGVGAGAGAGVVDAAGGVAGATEEADAGAKVVAPLFNCASKAADCAEKVVDDTGHPVGTNVSANSLSSRAYFKGVSPTPGPTRFCKVTDAAVSLANALWMELSVGKTKAPIPELLTARPAAMLALRSLMKRVRSGGQSQGISTPGTAPEQSPVPGGRTGRTVMSEKRHQNSQLFNSPVGFSPLTIPNSGTSDGSTPRGFKGYAADNPMQTRPIVMIE